MAEQQSQEMASESDVSCVRTDTATGTSAVKEELELQGATSKLESDAEASGHAGIERLLQKHRSEIMFELRRLQHGDKPVTGQDNKKNVEEFFLRTQAESEGRISTPAEEHRPEAVTVEVSALVERRPVQSVLQSAQFRRSLERALLGSISTISRRPRPPAPISRTGSPAQANSHSPQAAASRQSSPTSGVDQSSVASFATAASRTSSRSSPETNTPPLVITRPDTPIEQQLPIIPAPPPLPTEGSLQLAEAWVQQQPIATVPEPTGMGQQMLTWDDIEEAHRDNIVADISQLVQQQLVTQTLEGEFRDVLENRMQRHLQTVNADGQRVQQFVQSLPRTYQHMRNDFSNLGIGTAGALSDHLDEISVISATAAVTVPQTRNTIATNREIQSLKAQMREMQNMLKLSFDMQMDIQRAIRQEVAAALSQVMGNASTTTVHSQTASRPVNDSKCLICLDKCADSVLYQCGHLCLCYTCGLELRQRGSNCPVCRAPIRDIIRTYRSTMD